MKLFEQIYKLAKKARIKESLDCEEIEVNGKVFCIFENDINNDYYDFGISEYDNDAPVMTSVRYTVDVDFSGGYCSPTRVPYGDTYVDLPGSEFDGEVTISKGAYTYYDEHDKEISFDEFSTHFTVPKEDLKELLDELKPKIESELEEYSYEHWPEPDYDYDY